MVYAVVKQSSGTSQALVTAKSRLAKTNLMIPRLELVAGHMAVNLAVNVRKALKGFKLANKLHCWLDSVVVLHGLNHHGEYRQFVENRVRKMRNHEDVVWRHVPTDDNPADVGSRGRKVEGHKLWWNGPDWLANEDQWPPNLVTRLSESSETERKVQREVFAVGVEKENGPVDRVLEKFDLCKALRVMCYVRRFINNCQPSTKKMTGEISTEEYVNQETFMVKQTQQRALSHPTFLEDKEQLRLEVNRDGIWECHGRIQGEYPIYLPDE